jgi:hypothetical protein
MSWRECRVVAHWLSAAASRRPHTTFRLVLRKIAEYRWYILALAGIAAFILGCIGWWKFYTHPPSPRQPQNPRFSDVAYWSFKDFLMNSPDSVRLPVELDIARFLAPAVAGWAGLSAIGLVFRERVLQMRIPLMRRHVVLCGLGSIGTEFLRHLHHANIKVVVVEPNAQTPNLELCRGWAVPVIVGDSQLPRSLHAAGVERAARLVAVTSEDAANAEIIAVANQLVRGRDRHGLRCVGPHQRPAAVRSAARARGA